MDKKTILIFALLGLVALVSACSTGSATNNQPAYSGGGGCGRIVGLIPAAPIDLPGIGGGLLIVILSGIATYLLSRKLIVIKKVLTPKVTFY